MRYSIVLLGFAIVLASSATTLADEAAAVAEIEKLGGTVRQIAQNTEQKETNFHLSGKDLTDDGLHHIKEVEKLVWLNLANTKITDDGLGHLAGIKTLTRLHLEKTNVGDAGLAHLANLENLEYLNLYGTQVSDEGLHHLKGLTNLKKLYLWQSKVTPEGVAKLQEALAKVDINIGAELSPPEKTLAMGQYVRIRLSGDKRTLQLAEVQVFEKDSGEELQKSAMSRQSSTYEEAESKRAHDGNTDQDYAQGSVSHTNEEKDPWWVLDLGGVKDIAKIKVFNRGDCCGDRLKDATIDVIDASLSVVWSETIAEAEDGSVAEFVAE